MLRLHIQPGVVGQWGYAGGVYRCSRSWIACHRHPALEDYHVTDGTRHLIVVRERRPGGVGPPAPLLTSSGYDTARSEAMTWPLDYVTVAMTAAEVTVSAGAFGTAPVYLTVAGDGNLYGSWDLAEVVTAAATRSVDRLALVRQLTYWYRYSHRTAVEGVVQLTERGRARFDRHGLAVAYPDAAEHALPRGVRGDADVLAGLHRLLAAVVGARVYDPERAAVELSGGIDSATVAVTLGERDPEAVVAGGMLIPGDAGRQQAHRRQLMRAAFRLGPDLTVVACDHPPLQPTGGRSQGELVGSWQNTYHEAEAGLYTQLAAHGVRTVFTGLGGDELMSLRPWEAATALDGHRRHPPWLTAEAVDLLDAGEADIAPASRVSEVTLMAFAAGAPLYLRSGLWPVSPLAHPDLINLAEWLPAQYRRRKRILRQRLIRAGLPAWVADPPLRENLAAVMSSGLERWGLPLLDGMLPDLELAELGLVDVDRLRMACAEARVAGAAREVDHALFQVIAAELFLGALSRVHPAATPPGPPPPALR